MCYSEEIRWRENRRWSLLGVKGLKFYVIYCLQAIYILDDKNYKLKHRIANGSLTGGKGW